MYTGPQARAEEPQNISRGQLPHKRIGRSLPLAVLLFLARSKGVCPRCGEALSVFLVLTTWRDGVPCIVVPELTPKNFTQLSVVDLRRADGVVHEWSATTPPLCLQW